MEDNNNVIEINLWLVLLSIIFPLAGLIFFLTMKTTQPKTAKICGICTLINFILMTICIAIFLLTSVAVEQTVGESGIVTMGQKAKIADKIGYGKDIINVNLYNAKNTYDKEKELNNGKANLSKHVKNALIQSQKELKNKELSLKGSGNTLYLSYDKYTITGTISSDFTITWSDINTTSNDTK